ncbi:hypothetical protein RJT34_23203 [Clitoria ternatea]|uniref:CP12 domain-containing protein n=1 Tax=Clitoria ternatea TaxID=43366 RepID=A0AAN9FU65_CLITE
MATIAGMSLSSPSRVFVNKGTESPQKAQLMKFRRLNQRWPSMVGVGRLVGVGPMRATPEKISEKVEESIKTAEEACAGGGDSGECAAAWDEVEELSAAASHARENQKNSDPLEKYCKDNPETEECRTYD